MPVPTFVFGLNSKIITKISCNKSHRAVLFSLFNANVLAKLYELARSIEKFGVLEPLLVRPLANNRYELISGERRLLASKIAELTEVPVNILDIDDYTTAQVRLVENLQREDLLSVTSIYHPLLTSSCSDATDRSFNLK